MSHLKWKMREVHGWSSSTTDVFKVAAIPSGCTSLNLYGQSVEDQGAKALGRALQKNTELTSLNLDGNSIANEGAKALAKALQTNSALISLNLHDNRVGHAGSKALAEALQTNTVTLFSPLSI